MTEICGQPLNSFEISLFERLGNSTATTAGRSPRSGADFDREFPDARHYRKVTILHV